MTKIFYSWLQYYNSFRADTAGDSQGRSDPINGSEAV